MAYIEFTSGNVDQKIVSIESDITIGRNPTNKLSIPDSSVSREHAKIILKNGYFSLIDLGSANGTLVNGVPLHKLVPQPLYDADEITIGSVEFTFYSQGLEPPSAQKTSGTRKHDKNKEAVPLVVAEDRSKTSVKATIDVSMNFLESVAAQKDTPQSMADAMKRLHAMVKITNDIGTESKIDGLANTIMNSIFDLFPQGDRAFVMLRDSQEGFKCIAARHRHQSGNISSQILISKTIIKMVTEQKQSILSSDTSQDNRFAEQLSIVNLSIRSLMCAPLLCQDDLLGLIGVDCTSGKGTFTPDDLAMLTGIAFQAAIAIKNAELFSAIERETLLRTQLSRYLSPDVVEGIIDGKIPIQLGGEKKYGTILFCDIVGFTTLAERIPATDLVDLLNQYYAIITEIITRNHGTVHKFGGDMVMAFWNVLFPDSQAQINAIRTALELQAAVWNFNIKQNPFNNQPIYLGIGCNTGEFAGGNVGGNERMEYTVIGDNVNLAQRIESHSCRYQILVSEESWNFVKDASLAIGLVPKEIKGRINPIKMYSIRGLKLDTNELLLSVPVHILTPDDKIAGWGLITRGTGQGSSLELHLQTNVTIPGWSRLTILFDLPELQEQLQMNGRIAVSNVLQSTPQHINTYLVITDLQGTQQALSFFTPGNYIESSKAWPDMKRH